MLRTQKNFKFKNVFTNLQKACVAITPLLILIACGGDSGSSAKPADDAREVATVVDMGRCTNEREGDTVYVAEKMADYLCKNRTWVDLSTISHSETKHSSSSVAKGTLSAASGNSSAVQGTSSATPGSHTSTSSSSAVAPNSVSGTSAGKESDPTQGFIRENISVTGVAQKGPFKFGSPLNLFELKNDLTPSGRVYNDEINSNKGDFVIPKVNLAYPYAKLEVRGLYRNEVTGEWSTDSMTLRALTDFSDKRTEVNINLLTHLEYDRVLYLVQEKGYSVYAAKKQAAQEIMTAFEFATAVTYSEDFAIFQNEGVSATTSAGNATLLAISALVMGNRSDAEIQNVIDKFIADIRTDGEWNDLQAKADMADWAYNLDYGNIRASVKSWNILDIPDFETYLDAYWNNVYGLGGCSVNRKDVVSPNTNKLSRNLYKYFICNGSRWVTATTFQKDTYEWTTGKDGEFKKGNVTDSVYVYDGSKWIVSERETTIGFCETKNVGVVSKFDGTYYICKNNAWTEATALEYDTYGLKGVEGDVKAGVVNKDKYYVYENGAWRIASDQEIALGICTTTREGEVAEDEGVFYTCRSKKWTIATNVEMDLGGCTAKREGEVSKSSEIYYICKSKNWTTATALEYDTYGWSAGVEGEIKAGDVNENTYYEYKNGKWSISSHGFMTDSRDGKTYKTVTIGTQTWMAENLNLNVSGALCYDDDESNCQELGRLYKWSTAQSVCPSGWHLPSSDEFEVLLKFVGDSLELETYNGGCLTASVCKSLRSATGWVRGNGTDIFGFSGYPAGYAYHSQYTGYHYAYKTVVAKFWTTDAHKYDQDYKYNMSLGIDEFDCSGLGSLIDVIHDGWQLMSVRCVKNSN